MSGRWGSALRYAAQAALTTGRRWEKHTNIRRWEMTKNNKRQRLHATWDENDTKCSCTVVMYQYVIKKTYNSEKPLIEWFFKHKYQIFVVLKYEDFRFFLLVYINVKYQYLGNLKVSSSYFTHISYDVCVCTFMMSIQLISQIYHTQVVHKTGPMLPDLRWGAAEGLHSNFLTAVQLPHRPYYHMHRVKHQRRRELWSRKRIDGGHGRREKVRKGDGNMGMKEKESREKKQWEKKREARVQIECLTRMEGGKHRKHEGTENRWGMSKPVGRKHRWIHQYPLNTSKKLAESL